MTIAEIFETRDAVGMAELVARGEVSPMELLDAAIERTERVNGELNAVVIPMFDLARDRIAKGLPDGPFKGVPFLLKELAAMYKGVPLRHASSLYEGNVPAAHSTIVERYEAAGLVVFGKTNSSELGILPTTESRRYGACHNPWKLGTTTGGSSGGAGAAVAARIVPAAHGGDAGGSIRIPASCCGVFGLKPTRGRNPFGPDTSERAHGLAQEHVLSLSVRDSAALLDVTAGPESVAPYWAPPKEGSYREAASGRPARLRIAYTTRPILLGQEDPDVRASIDDAVALLRSLGHVVEEKHPPIDAEKASKHFFTLYCAGVGGEIEMAEKKLGRPITLEHVETTTLMMSLIGRKVLSAAQFSEAIRELQAISRDMARFLVDYDLLLTPTLGKPPVPHGSLFAKGMEARVQEMVAKHSLSLALKLPGVIDKAIGRAYGFAPFTQVANVTGQPSMSVPLYWSAEGLPLGACFTARFGDEVTLFKLAAELEEARPWRGRVPPVHA
ncbi:MAG: amidase [Polyangiaceae bacterium]